MSQRHLIVALLAVNLCTGAQFPARARHVLPVDCQTSGFLGEPSGTPPPLSSSIAPIYPFGPSTLWVSPNALHSPLPFTIARFHLHFPPHKQTHLFSASGIIIQRVLLERFQFCCFALLFSTFCRKEIDAYPRFSSQASSPSASTTTQKSSDYIGLK